MFAFIDIAVAALWGALGGLSLGAWLRDRIWRDKARTGCRMASGGRLFVVREDGDE